MRRYTLVINLFGVNYTRESNNLDKEDSLLYSASPASSLSAKDMQTDPSSVALVSSLSIHTADKKRPCRDT